jgi:hypothetical protein
MSPDDEPTRPTLLTAAANGLRRRADERWVEIADRITAAALAATRRSVPVRARTPGGGEIRIAEQVLVAYLRHALDGGLPRAATTAVTVDVEGRDTFAGVVIQLSVRYGTPLLPLADRARAIAAQALTDLLGSVEPHVDVRTMHVHIADVIQGDPHRVDPS